MEFDVWRMILITCWWTRLMTMMEEEQLQGHKQWHNQAHKPKNHHHLTWITSRISNIQGIDRFLGVSSGSITWRHIEADSIWTGLRGVKKEKKILTIHSLVTPVEGKLRKVMVRTEKQRWSGGRRMGGAEGRWKEAMRGCWEKRRETKVEDDCLLAWRFRLQSTSAC